MGKVKTCELLEYLGVQPINAAQSDLDRNITTPSMHRLGLELARKKELTGDIRHIIGWGTKESNYLLSIEKEERMFVLTKLIDKIIPLITLSKGVCDEITNNIIEVANLTRTPVLKINYHLSSFYISVSGFLSEKLAKSESVHGSLVNINGIGVMLVGKSGIGKSEAVLDLIKKGSYFVSDDTVEIKRIGTHFYGYPAKITKGYLEARGIGLIDIGFIYGHQSTRDSSEISLVIELIGMEKGVNFDRLGNELLSYNVLNAKIPKMQIPVDKARSLSTLIESATNVFIAKRNGHDPLMEMRENFKEDNNE